MRDQPSAPERQSRVAAGILDQAETLSGALEELVERFPGFECLSMFDRHGREQRLSFAALWGRARQIESAFVARGLQPGDFALLVMPTGPELVCAYFGVILAGAVPGLLASPLNRFADPGVYVGHLSSIIDLAGARLLYCDQDTLDVLRGGNAAWLDSTAVLTPADTATPQAGVPVVNADPDSVATVQYSSGSTGAPKGALLTHRAILNNVRATRDALGLSADDVSVNWIPLYHDMGLIDAFLLPLLTGGCGILIPTTDFVRDPALWLRAIHRYRAAISWGPNFAYALCAKRLADRDIEGLDLSSWRLAMNASEPVLAHTIDAFTDRFAPLGFRPEAMTPAWGLAETVCIATAHPAGERPWIERIDRQPLVARGLASPCERDGLRSVGVGRCLPDCAVEIRDQQGHVLQDRGVGTVWLKTTSLLAGYQRAPSLTARVVVDGWLDTGDRGYLADGHLFFVSREKDLIVIGGEKYAPHDVESAINSVLGVREGCAVAFGVMNEERGTEDVAAVVETKESDGKALAALRDEIRHNVTRTTGLALRYVVLVPPGGVLKTTSGKLARGATAQRHADQIVDDGQQVAAPPPDLSSRILEFVRGELAGARVELTLETALVTSGLLDSVALVRLAALVERETGTVIPDRDLTADHFNSVRLIEAYLAARAG